MTNKKLKLAAMSVALTACVAAQPMAAHAVEGPDSVEDNAAPQAEPASLWKVNDRRRRGRGQRGQAGRNPEREDTRMPLTPLAAMTLRWIMITAKIPSPTMRTVPPPLTAPVL